MVPLIYIAGPMTAPDGWVWEQNVRRAEEIAFELVSLGASPVCPQTLGRHFRGTMNHETWMKVDLAKLRVCHALVTIPGWENSKGAREEVRFARDHGIPVLSLPPLPWNKPVRSQIDGFITDLCYDKVADRLRKAMG